MSRHRPAPRAGIEFPHATWTSFDRYGRYAAIVGALRASLGPGPHRVLDVGDTAGYLQLFDPELSVVGVDIELEADPLPDLVRAQADGTRLPFPADAFDAVISSDVLEHVPQPARAAFLTELTRVSRDLVVVAAPFDTPGVSGAEELARRYAFFSAGVPQRQLEEHRLHGLPDLAASVATLEQAGWTTATAGNGNLWDWLLMMLLRFQLDARRGLRALGEGYDELYNQSLATRAGAGPFYRHLVVARTPGRPPALGPGATGEAGLIGATNATEGLDVPALLGSLIAADAAEVARHDTRDRLDELTDQVSRLEARLEALIELEVSQADQAEAMRSRVRRLARPFRGKTPPS
jgi:SAM-dependent methyltransferase